MTPALIQIQRQYERIPSFVCIEGCTDCCGPVPMTAAEATQIEIKPYDGLRCQYATKSGCSIYEHRPLLCRLFGTVDHEKLRCPHGKRPAELLTHRQGDTIMRHYLKHEMVADPLVELLDDIRRANR